MNIERITITFNKDGTFRGASSEGWDNMPVPLDTNALNAIAPAINSALLAELEGAQLLVTAAFAAKDKLLAAAQDPETDLNEVAAAIIAEAEKPEIEKQNDAIRAQIAELQAKLQ